MTHLSETSYAVRSPELRLLTQDYRAPCVVGPPDEVLRRPDLTVAQKRAILASWVSDARAVENAPSLRRLDNGAVVTIEDVLKALRSLDAHNSPSRSLEFRPLVSFGRRKRARAPRWLRRSVRIPPDDDDPPPSPAAAGIPVPLEFTIADASHDQRWLRPTVAGLSAL
jgi:hypothetical protein